MASNDDDDLVGLFQLALLTTAGRPVLLPGEVERHLLPAVDLEPEPSSSIPTFPPYKSGLLILTTHRLLWIPSSVSAGAVAVPLSAVKHIFSHKKSIKSMFHSPRLRFQARSVVVTAVARGGGGAADVEAFLGKFWECWRARAWEEERAADPGGEGLYGGDGTVRMVGVAGILRKEQEIWETTDKTLQEAFQDLNALMSKAKEMMMLAEKMRQKLLPGSSSQGNAGNDEGMGSKEEMQDWLLSVGIISPVTKESAGALYHQQLSRQLADFVRMPLERAGGMMNLIDVYCLFNRARGTELISPEDLLQACSLWEKFDVPVMLRKFDSGVMIIQNKSHSDEEIFARIKSLATKPVGLRSGITASDAALTLGIAPAMAKEHLLSAESKGLLCRDVSADGFSFYINIFPEINSDDMHLVKEHGIYSVWIKAASPS